METRPGSKNIEKYTTIVKLIDGSPLLLRAIRPDDQERLVAFVGRLSSHARYLRFHHTVSRLSEEEARHFSNIDYKDSFALVAIIGEGGEEEIIAVGRYYRMSDSDAAEVAFTVEDKYQMKGIGTHLLEQLMIIARQNGIRVFEAFVLPENKNMLEVFFHEGFRVSEQLEDGVLRLVLEMAAF